MKIIFFFLKKWLKWKIDTLFCRLDLSETCCCAGIWWPLLYVQSRPGKKFQDRGHCVSLSLRHYYAQHWSTQLLHQTRAQDETGGLHQKPQGWVLFLKEQLTYKALLSVTCGPVAVWYSFPQLGLIIVLCMLFFNYSKRGVNMLSSVGTGVAWLRQIYKLECYPFCTAIQNSLQSTVLKNILQSTVGAGRLNT